VGVLCTFPILLRKFQIASQAQKKRCHFSICGFFVEAKPTSSIQFEQKGQKNRNVASASHRLPQSGMSMPWGGSDEPNPEGDA
jgi:hypothetical protein